MSTTGWVFFFLYIFLLGMLVGGGMESKKCDSGVGTALASLLLLTIVCVTRAVVLMP